MTSTDPEQSPRFMSTAPDAHEDIAAAPATPTPTPTARNTSVIVGAAGLVIGLTLGLIAGLAVIPAIGNLASGALSAALPSPIVGAVESCGVESNVWIEVGDEGQSLSMTSRGEESPGAEFDEIFCVLDALGTPDSVVNRMNTTRALDGRQSANWDDLSATWGYHPNSGFNIVIDARRD